MQREGKKPVTTTIAHRVFREVDVPLQGSDIHADFALVHRRRGLMWGARAPGRSLFPNARHRLLDLFCGAGQRRGT
ncbi:MAG: hypothetical protein OEV36_08785 [Myxococcales bacterium]|nr:hypothetical protein [Myxococcales bacterium]